MIEVPPHPRREQDATQIAAFDVSLTNSKTGVMVTLLSHPNAPDTEPFDIVLSPPAAHQLAKALRRTMKGYLNQQRQETGR